MIQQFFGQCAALCCCGAALCCCGANVTNITNSSAILPCPPDGEYHMGYLCHRRAKFPFFIHICTNIQPKKTNLAPESFLNSPNFSYDIKETPPRPRPRPAPVDSLVIASMALTVAIVRVGTVLVLPPSQMVLVYFIVSWSLLFGYSRIAMHDGWCLFHPHL